MGGERYGLYLLQDHRRGDVYKRQAFDPELHHAVMKEVTDDPGKVIEVFQKGYRVKDKIIRYAMVKVSVEE